MWEYWYLHVFGFLCLFWWGIVLVCLKMMNELLNEVKELQEEQAVNAHVLSAMKWYLGNDDEEFFKYISEAERKGKKNYLTNNKKSKK